MILINRQGKYKKTPKKPSKLKSSKLPKKDKLRKNFTKKNGFSSQEVANPMKSSSQCFTEKPVNSIILDNVTSQFKERELNFTKKVMPGKISGHCYDGYILDKKRVTNREIPIKLNMMSASELKD